MLTNVVGRWRLLSAGTVLARALPSPRPLPWAVVRSLMEWECLHDSDGGEQDKRCGLLACLGGKSLGSLVGNKTQRFPDAAGFLHCLCLVRNSCFAMLLQKFYQLIESFLSDFWPGMVHDAGISPCVTGVFIPALVVSAAYSAANPTASMGPTTKIRLTIQCAITMGARRLCLCTMMPAVTPHAKNANP